VAVGLAMRVGLVERHGLWADEIFSLAIATGHSLEHPSWVADPALGDYVESPQPLPPSAYRAYLEHDQPPAGLGRVARAVRLSETSPPLYYFLLYAWTRALGTSDASLRMFSIFGWTACLPLIWSLGRQLGGRATARACLALFAFAPLSIFYSTEGRMYSWLWFFTVAAALLTYQIHRRGSRAATLTLWVSVCAGGMLTHYFFVFVWAAFTAWILGFPGRARRPTLIAAVTAVAVLIAPWYIQLPASFSAWRVTKGWLEVEPAGFNRVVALAKLAGSYVSPVGAWWSGHRRLSWLLVGSLAMLLLTTFGLARWRIFARHRVLMLGLWVLAAVLGPLSFDLLRHTYTIDVPRYAIAGMPAAFLLIALALRSVRGRAGPILLVLIIGLWIPSYFLFFRQEARNYTPFREVGRTLSNRAGPADLVLVHSIPGGIAGVARYVAPDSALERGSGMASWVERLGDRRVPESLLALGRGRRRIILVKIHEVAQPAPEAKWLRRHARLVGEDHFVGATMLSFAPHDSANFEPDPTPPPESLR
jgi:4-amino-4-deoxy-L-arabinose transferase-like glycosyltransferase